MLAGQQDAVDEVEEVVVLHGQDGGEEGGQDEEEEAGGHGWLGSTGQWRNKIISDKLFSNIVIYMKLKDTARYEGLLLVPAEGFGRGFFCPSDKKRAYYAVFVHFWQFLVSSSNQKKF